MADNSTETSTTHFSINDGIASLLQDPAEENQAVDEAQPEEAEMVEAGDPEVEADDTEGKKPKPMRPKPKMLTIRKPKTKRTMPLTMRPKMTRIKSPNFIPSKLMAKRLR